MPDPTIAEVIRRVRARLKRVRPLDDYEELAEGVMSAYREVVRTWPWGFLLQRYRTRVLRPVNVTVELSANQSSISVINSDGDIDWSLQPTLTLPGRRPFFTDGAGNLVEPFIGQTGTYDGKLIYNIIPLFDVVFWGVSITDSGPLQKMSFQMLEYLSPNRDKIGKPWAFVPYTPFCELFPAPDREYDLDVWIVPSLPNTFDANYTVASPLVDAVIYKACAILLAQGTPQLVPIYMDLYEKEITRLKSVDTVGFSWPEFHLSYEIGTHTVPFPSYKVTLP